MTKLPRGKFDDPTKSQLEDHVNRAIRAVASLVLPQAVMEYLQFIVGDPAQERRDDFLKALFEKLREVEAKSDRLSPDNLSKNTAFQATLLQAVQIASRTAQEEKLEMLRNAIVNSALLDLDENIRQILVQNIDRLTALHVALLNLLDDPEANDEVRRRLKTLMTGGIGLVIDAGLPALRGQTEFAKMLATDLERANLLQPGAFGATMTAQGLKTPRTTNLGRDFLTFISEPVTQTVL